MQLSMKFPVFVRNRTLFVQKLYEINIGEALGRCIENDPAVHISNSNGLLLQTMTSDFAVKRAAAYFETPGGLMLVPAGFMKHPLSGGRGSVPISAES